MTQYPLSKALDGHVFVTDFKDWRASISSLLDAAGLPGLLANQSKVLIKPNLVEALAPPITTPVQCVAALAGYLRDRAPHVEILIGEGTGAKEYETRECFEKLGYLKWAAGFGVELIDLNHAPLVRHALPGCSRWPEIYLPEIVFDCFLISVPVLKAHTLAQVTLTMKNMMGLAPPSHYQQGGHWKKAAFHDRVQEAVLDLNRYRTPDFTLLDATVGMAKAHLTGPTCQPPKNKLAAGRDPVAIDAYGAGLLGLDWQQIGHLAKAHGELGKAEPLKIVEVGNG